MTRKMNKYLMKSDYYQKKRKQQSLLKGLLGVLFICIIIILFYFIFQAKLTNIETSYQFIYHPTMQDDDKSNLEDKEKYSYLVVAIGDEKDDTSFVSRAKYLEHITIDQTDQQITRVQIPPQTVPSWDDDHLPLSHLYTEHGISSVIQRTEEIMAVDYDYVVAIYLPYLRPLIDEIGAIPLQFEESLTLDGQLFKAKQIYWMNGQQVDNLLQATKYDNRKEYPRITQSVLDGLMSEIFHLKNILNLDHYFEVAESSIRTDVPFEMFQTFYLNRDKQWLENITEIELEQRGFQNEYGTIVEIDPRSLDLIHQLAN